MYVESVMRRKSALAIITPVCGFRTLVKCFGYGWYHNVANTSQRQSYNQNPVTVSNASGVEINAYAYACY